MMFELLLFSVVVTSGYLGTTVLRRLGPSQRGYGVMVIADMVLALLAFVSRTLDGPNAIADMVGAIAIGAAICLFVLPPLLRDIGKRLISADYLRTAKFLAEFRQLLQPGMGARPEIELIETVLAVRNGREDDIIKAIENAKSEIEEPELWQALDERIVMIYLYAQRWNDAAHHYEKLGQIGHRASAPQLAVEMVRAYCEIGQIDKAGDVVRRIDESPLAHEPVLAALFARGYMMFLAFLGRAGAVQSMIGPNGALADMPDAARSYWLGVARLYASDHKEARASLLDAIRLSEGDPRGRKTAEELLGRMDSGSALVQGNVSVPTAELADRLTKYAKSSVGLRKNSIRKVPSLRGVALSKIPVTICFVLCNVLASLAVYRMFNGITDLGALVSAGANLKSATTQGEWWRLGSSMFLHVGFAHLFLNVYGLWVLGRLVEQMLGSVRTLAICVFAGLTAGLASTFWGGITTAVGASGVVLGLMGAASVELAVYRQNYPREWSSPLLRLLLLLSLAQIVIGFFYPIVDQWGHIGGLFGGVLAGVVLSPHANWAKTIRVFVGRMVALAAVAVLGYSFFGVVSTDYTETLRRYPLVTQVSDELMIAMPGAWEKIGDTQFVDPGISASFDLRRVSAADGLDAAISSRLEQEQFGGALAAGFDTAKPSARSGMNLPHPWRGGELDVRVNDSSGQQHFRLVVFGTVAGDEIWLGTYYHPAVLTRWIEPVFAQILASISPRQEMRRALP